jgi:heme-degrading monooxygenase HmoA
MYTSTFIFSAKDYDDDFHRLNAEIAERARAIPGFLGEEEWMNELSGLHSEVYYWESEEAMRQLIGMPMHKVAKSAHERWIGPYRVVIAEVLTTYGQPGLGLDHVPVRSA